MEKSQKSPEPSKGLISNLRDGIDLVRMVLFSKLKDSLKDGPYEKRGERFIMHLCGAVINELFGTQNPEEPFSSFAKENKAIIQKELSGIPKRFPELLIPITDALRMHFFCNHAEGHANLSPSYLERAKEMGILLDERPTPLPKNFMELVYKIGLSYGLIRHQENE